MISGFEYSSKQSSLGSVCIPESTYFNAQGRSSCNFSRSFADRITFRSGQVGRIGGAPIKMLLFLLCSGLEISGLKSGLERLGSLVDIRFNFESES